MSKDRKWLARVQYMTRNLVFPERATISSKLGNPISSGIIFDFIFLNMCVCGGGAAL